MMFPEEGDDHDPLSPDPSPDKKTTKEEVPQKPHLTLVK